MLKMAEKNSLWITYENHWMGVQFRNFWQNVQKFVEKTLGIQNDMKKVLLSVISYYLRNWKCQLFFYFGWQMQ